MTPPAAPRALSVPQVGRRCLTLIEAHPWQVLTGVFVPWLGAVPFQLPSLVIGLLGADPSGAVAIAATAADLVSALVGLFLQLGAIRLFVALAAGREVRLAMLLGEGRCMPAALVTAFLLGLGVAGGLVLFVVPGLWLALRLQLALHALVDQRIGPLEALRESWRLTSANPLELLWISLAIGLAILVVSCGTLGLAAMVILPVVSLVQAVVYHELRAP